jgi:hypothetical protein
MRIVQWLTWWRVLDAKDRIVAVCTTYDEAVAYIANQPAAASQGASR